MLEVKTAATYRVEPGHWYGRVYLGGVELTKTSVVDLRPGRYPMLVPVIVGNPTGQATPRFVPTDREAALAKIAKAQADYEKAAADYERDYKAWVAGGKKVVSAQASLTGAQRDVRRWLIMGVGNGGFFT